MHVPTVVKFHTTTMPVLCRIPYFCFGFPVSRAQLCVDLGHQLGNLAKRWRDAPENAEPAGINESELQSNGISCDPEMLKPFGSSFGSSWSIASGSLDLALNHQPPSLLLAGGIGLEEWGMSQPEAEMPPVNSGCCLRPVPDISSLSSELGPLTCNVLVHIDVKKIVDKHHHLQPSPYA